MNTNSIDPGQVRALARFYQRNIAPLSAQPEMQQIEHAPPDSDNTFFVTCKRPRMGKQDFELHFADEQQAIETLERIWAGTPLKRLPRKMVKLARHFKQTDQSDEVSSFVYEMF